MTLLESIEIHLAKTGIAPTRFGRRAVGDPRLVLDMRMGRRPGSDVTRRIEAHLRMAT